MNPLVSVIVPVYKVEEYIAQCLESILKQTYSHLEILIVNDGSPDRSREIAASYQDKRIKIIDKANGGLSDARNAGMAHVEGEYTVFVDSDDWLAPTFIEKTLELALSKEADIVQSGFYYAYPDALLLDNRMNAVDSRFDILDNKSLMKKLIENLEVKNFAWGKIYRTNLIKDIPFRKGMLFEDMFWAHLVMARVTTYVVYREPLCYYRQREESIVGSYTLKHLDIIAGMKERLSFIESNYYDLSPIAYRQLGKLQLEHYRLLLNVKPYNAQRNKRNLIKKELNQEKQNMLQAVAADKELSRKLKLFYIHPHIYIMYLIFNKVRRIINKNPPEGPLVKVQDRGGLHDIL
jgi:glycosyltransferase involved in cell wall biosynthesis